MQRIYLLVVVSVAGYSQTADSLQQQRASIMKQVAMVTGKAAPPATSFFTVPWTDERAALTAADCDPMPSDQLDRLIDENSRREDVDPELIRAVIHQESGNRPCAESSMGAQGLMQLMPATGGEFGVRDRFDPKENVEAGTKLLKQLLDKYEGDVSLALAAYNAGESRVDHAGAVPPIPETMDYILRILSQLANR